MQTYQNLLANQGFKPHLESQDFRVFLKISIISALLLAMLFSIRGNILGLNALWSGENIFWSFIVGLSVTVTSALLAIMGVVKIQIKTIYRVLILTTSLVLFASSGGLTYLGFENQDEKAVKSSIQENAELQNARTELKNIQQRQVEYGISNVEKNSLLAREREWSAYVRELEGRLLAESRFQKSTIEKSLGNSRKYALVIFSITPEICIGALAILLTLLFNTNIVTLRDEKRIESESPGIESQKIIYVPVQMPGNNGGGVEKQAPGVPSQAELASIVQSNQGNGAAAKQLQGWNPFQ